MDNLIKTHDRGLYLFIQSVTFFPSIITLIKMLMIFSSFQKNNVALMKTIPVFELKFGGEQLSYKNLHYYYEITLRLFRYVLLYDKENSNGIYILRNNFLFLLKNNPEDKTLQIFGELFNIKFRIITEMYNYSVEFGMKFVTDLLDCLNATINQEPLDVNLSYKKYLQVFIQLFHSQIPFNFFAKQSLRLFKLCQSLPIFNSDTIKESSVNNQIGLKLFQLKESFMIVIVKYNIPELEKFHKSLKRFCQMKTNRLVIDCCLSFTLILSQIEEKLLVKCCDNKRLGILTEMMKDLLEVCDQSNEEENLKICRYCNCHKVHADHMTAMLLSTLAQQSIKSGNKWEAATITIILDTLLKAYKGITTTLNCQLKEYLLNEFTRSVYNIFRHFRSNNDCSTFIEKYFTEFSGILIRNYKLIVDKSTTIDAITVVTKMLPLCRERMELRCLCIALMMNNENKCDKAVIMKMFENLNFYDQELNPKKYIIVKILDDMDCCSYGLDEKPKYNRLELLKLQLESTGSSRTHSQLRQNVFKEILTTIETTDAVQLGLILAQSQSQLNRDFPDQTLKVVNELEKIKRKSLDVTFILGVLHFRLYLLKYQEISDERTDCTITHDHLHTGEFPFADKDSLLGDNEILAMMNTSFEYLSSYVKKCNKTLEYSDVLINTFKRLGTHYNLRNCLTNAAESWTLLYIVSKSSNNWIGIMTAMGLFSYNCEYHSFIQSRYPNIPDIEELYRMNWKRLMDETTTTTDDLEKKFIVLMCFIGYGKYSLECDDIERFHSILLLIEKLSSTPKTETSLIDIHIQRLLLLWKLKKTNSYNNEFTTSTMNPPRLMIFIMELLSIIKGIHYLRSEDSVELPILIFDCINHLVTVHMNRSLSFPHLKYITQLIKFAIKMASVGRIVQCITLHSKLCIMSEDITIATVSY